MTKNRPKGTSGATQRAQNDGFSQHLYKEESDWDVVDRVSALAEKRGVSNAEVALAWLLHQPSVTAPIIGATKLHHIDQAVQAVDLKLEPDEIKSLNEPYRPHSVLGH